jgi:murein L,D-transpeptidase YafK
VKELSRLAFSALLLAAMSLAATAAPKVDKVVVFKKARLMHLVSAGKTLRSYKIALGGDPVGPKTREGDHKTPEGSYVLDRRNAASRFYKSIHISYPTLAQSEAARKMGASPGGDVMIHGLPNGFGWIGSAHRLYDWTDGCIAVTNAEMDEIWDAVSDGTAIEINP